MNDSNWEAGETFSDRFRHFLGSEGLSQTEVAQMLHSNQAHISRLTRGTHKPNFEDITQIARVWGRDVAIRLIFPNQQSAAGITWSENYSTANSEATINEINESLRAFHTIMEADHSNELIVPHEFTNERKLLHRVMQCFLSGAVRIQHVERSTHLEQDLKSKYNLRDCIISNINLAEHPVIDTVIRAEAVAFLAAKHTLYSVIDAIDIGITGGSPIYRFIDLLLSADTRLRGKTWWALLNTFNLFSGGAPPGTTANDAIARLAHSQPGSNFHYLPYIHPSLVENESDSSLPMTEREQIRLAKLTLHRARQVDTAYISVGSYDVSAKRVGSPLRTPALLTIYDSLTDVSRKSVTGDILLRLVDHEGNILGDTNTYDSFVYSVSLDDLRSIVARGGLVWILAERPEKAPVVRAALDSGIANAVVLDKVIAEQLS